MEQLFFTACPAVPSRPIRKSGFPPWAACADSAAGGRISQSVSGGRRPVLLVRMRTCLPCGRAVDLSAGIPALPVICPPAYPLCPCVPKNGACTRPACFTGPARGRSPTPQPHMRKSHKTPLGPARVPVAVFLFGPARGPRVSALRRFAPVLLTAK